MVIRNLEIWFFVELSPYPQLLRKPFLVNLIEPMFGRKSIGHINSVGKETKEKEKDVFYSHHFLISITLIMLRILPTSNHCSIRYSLSPFISDSIPRFYFSSIQFHFSSSYSNQVFLLLVFSSWRRRSNSRNKGILVGGKSWIYAGQCLKHHSL